MALHRDYDALHGATPPSGQARGAARCGSSGKQRNVPRGPSDPTEGRDLLSARRVAGCLWWMAPPRSPRLAGGQNLRGAKHHNLCGEPLVALSIERLDVALATNGTEVALAR